MARKPLDQLSPAYRRRIENAMKKGKTRQQARGKPAKEHVIRKEREIAERGISSAQEKTITSWYERTYNPAGYPENARADLEEVLEMARGEGYAAFVQWRTVWDLLRRTYLAEQADGSYASRGESFMIDMANQAGRSELSWLYYH